MAHPKREKPLTVAEKKARNRRYAAKHRAKTNNNTTRAHNRAVKRAADWVKAEKPNLWKMYLQEETRKEEKKPYRELCPHGADLHATGIGVGCDKCGKAVGVLGVSDEERKVLNDMVGA